MSNWVWLQRAVVVAIDEMQLVEHGGMAGVRDVNLRNGFERTPRRVDCAAYNEQDLAKKIGCRTHR